MRLVVATRSQHKMREIREILSDVPGLEVLDLDGAEVSYDPDEETLEPFETFEEVTCSRWRSESVERTRAAERSMVGWGGLSWILIVKQGGRRSDGRRPPSPDVRPIRTPTGSVPR